MSLNVSVVIPTYNAQRFIGETLQSVLSQSFKPLEIVVVDDCSTDDTREVVKCVADSQSDSVPIRLLQTERASGGPAHPINVGIAASRGDYISLLDHDDLMESDKLELQCASLRAAPDSLLSFGNYTWFTEAAMGGGIDEDMLIELIRGSERRGNFYVVPPDVMLQLQLVHPGVVQSCSNLLFHRSLWELAGPFDLNISAISDYAFKLRAALFSSATFVPVRTFRKRVHAANLFTQSEGPQLWRDINRLRFEAMRRHPELTFRDRRFREIKRRHIVMFIQYYWYKDNLGKVLEYWRDGLNCLGLEFLADSLRWVFFKSIDKMKRKCGWT